MFSDRLSAITLNPTRIVGFRRSSVLLEARPPLDHTPFLFVPSVRLFVPLGVAISTIGTPGLLPLFTEYAAGLSPMKSGVIVVSRFRIGRFSRLCFHRGNPPLAPVSSHNRCLIAPCSQLHSPRIELGRCGQIGSHA